MTIPPDDIAFAKRICASFPTCYRGPNPLTAGSGIEDAEERREMIEAAFTIWSGFAKGWFMAMLNTLGGAKPLALVSEIDKFCTPPEAAGARAAMDLFWKREVALRGPGERAGGVTLNSLQRAILVDDTIGGEIFGDVERTMEAAILQTLRTRRNFMRQNDPDADHALGLQQDIAYFFGTGRPVRLPARKRNENFDGLLF